MSFFEAFLLGVVEGLTEFLPVSSTGHMILVSRLLGIEQIDAHKSFEIVIQLGSILAVVATYFRRFSGDVSALYGASIGLRSRKLSAKNFCAALRQNLLIKLGVGFLPAGIVGFLLYKHIKELFAAETVAYALIAGGVILIAIELFFKPKSERVTALDAVGFKRAFLIGCAQCLAMIPGASRSASTIAGGLLCKLDRKTAIEFSFLLAVPTMLIATCYELIKNYEYFSADETINLAVGFITAFFVAVIVIKGFLRFVSRFNFIPFGIYRIIIGSIFLWTAAQ